MPSLTYITSSPVDFDGAVRYISWYSVYFLIDGNFFIYFVPKQKDRMKAVRILAKVQADNLALPLALLLARTFLPPALLILALKP